MKSFNKRRLIAFVVGTALTIAPFSIQLAEAQTTRRTNSLLTGIELTQQQQTRLTQLGTQARNQIAKTLRPEQIQAFKAAIAQGSTFRQAISATELTKEQQAQLKQLLLLTRKQAADVLTTEQKRQLLQNLQSTGFQLYGNR